MIGNVKVSGAGLFGIPLFKIGKKLKMRRPRLLTAASIVYKEASYSNA